MVARNRVVISGPLLADERWSTGITFANFADPEVPNITDPAQLSEWADDVLTLLSNSEIYPTLRSLLSNAGGVDTVNTYFYPAAGPATAVGISQGAGTVGTGSVSVPPQCSVVMTLLTGLAGRSFRGRCYWPGVGGDIVSPTGRLAFQSAIDAAAEFADLLGAIAEAGLGGGVFLPAVHSSTRDVVTPVTEISVGDVFDTQRSRRNDMVEQRSFSPVVV